VKLEMNKKGIILNYFLIFLSIGLLVGIVFSGNFVLVVQGSILFYFYNDRCCFM